MAKLIDVNGLKAVVQKINADTPLTRKLEISRDAVECLIFGVASDILKADVSANYSVYEYKYQELKQKLNDLGYEVNMLKITHLSHSRFVANKNAVTTEFFNVLEKKLPEIQNFQFVYDPTETYSVGSDFTVILAEQ